MIYTTILCLLILCLTILVGHGINPNAGLGNAAGVIVCLYMVPAALFLIAIVIVISPITFVVNFVKGLFGAKRPE